jgi:hypothetical protein
MENPWFSRPPESLFETVISSYRHSLDLHLDLHPRSTLTGLTRSARRDLELA